MGGSLALSRRRGWGVGANEAHGGEGVGAKGFGADEARGGGFGANEAHGGGGGGVGTNEAHGGGGGGGWH